MPKAKRVPKEKPYGGGRYTKSQFFSFIRSALRQKSRRWAPIYEALSDARRTNKSSNKRLKWEYRCASCGKWKPGTNVSVDHIIPAGTLRDFEDLPQFVRLLFCEKDNLQVLCDDCHTIKTNEERKNKNVKDEEE